VDGGIFSAERPQEAEAMRVQSVRVLATFPAFGALAPSTPEADVSIVEDWAQQAIGATGVASGWNPYATVGGRPAYDFTVAEEDGHRALHLKSHDDHSTIAKKIRVDLRATPILEWTWKIVELPAGAAIRKKETSDLTGHIFVAWPRFPTLLRTRLIGYVWDTIGNGHARSASAATAHRRRGGSPGDRSTPRAITRGMARRRRSRAPGRRG